MARLAYPGLVDPEHPSTPPPVERAPDLALLAEVEGELAAVQGALARLDEGTYGTCQTCGAAIDDALLAASPTTSLCGDHGPT